MNVSHICGMKVRKIYIDQTMHTNIVLSEVEVAYIYRILWFIKKNKQK